MANPLQIGAPVEEFPGRTFNELVADLMARKGGQPNQARDLRCTRPGVVVTVHNSEAADCAPHEILGIDGPAISLDDDDKQIYHAPILKGVTPALPDHASNFAVAQDLIRGTTAVSGGTCGPMVISGLTWVKVYWTDNAHTKVKVADGSRKLEGSSGGIKPVWIESAYVGDLPKDVMAIINLGGQGGGGDVNLRRCRTLTAFSAATGYSLAEAGTGSLVILDSDGNTTETIDPAYNNYADDIADDVPGWALTDSDGNTWIVNAGCSQVIVGS